MASYDDIRYPQVPRVKFGDTAIGQGLGQIGQKFAEYFGTTGGNIGMHLRDTFGRPQSPNPNSAPAAPAHGGYAASRQDFANAGAQAPEPNPTAPVAPSLPGANVFRGPQIRVQKTAAMSPAPAAPTDQRQQLLHSMMTKQADFDSWEPRFTVGADNSAWAQYQQARLGNAKAIADMQADITGGNISGSKLGLEKERIGLERELGTKRLENERPGAASEELFKHPERASSIGLLKGLTPEQAAVLGSSVKNAVNPQPISPLNYRSRLSEYPDLQRLLDDPTRKVHEILDMARRFPGAEDQNNPIAQLIQAHYQNYLSGDENVRNLYADYLGQTPHEQGQSWLGYLSPFNIGGHAERARQADIVRSGLKQFNVPIPPRPSSF